MARPIVRPAPVAGDTASVLVFIQSSLFSAVLYLDAGDAAALSLRSTNGVWLEAAGACLSCEPGFD
ncbi:hypothetical protein D3C83_186440 [compost metagenome]